MSSDDNAYVVEVDLADGEEREVDLRIYDPATLTVQVTDSTGRPISGAEVFIRSGQNAMLGFGRRDGMTDAEGRFVDETARSGETVWATASHPDFLSGDGGAVMLSANQPADYAIVLYAGGGVIATVTDADGGLVANAPVALSIQDGDFRHHRVQLTTDRDGVLTLEHNFIAGGVEFIAAAVDFFGGPSGGGDTFMGWRSGPLQFTPGAGLDLGVIQLDETLSMLDLMPGGGGRREERRIEIRRE